MDVANEILDAIEIIVDKKIRENTVQIYPGVCKSVSGNSCVMSINGRDNTVQFYGSTPAVGSIYRVFVPNGNMSMAFIIVSNDDSSSPSVESASIFVTGLSETDSVSATKDGKEIIGKWVPESESGRFTAGHPEYIVSAANSLLYTYSSRNYKKAYDGDAYACTVVVNGWLAPLLVGKTANSVAYYTDGDYSSGIMRYEKTVTFMGETWYVSSSGAAYQATAPATSNVAHFGAFATREDAALAFLKNVAPQPMDGFEIAPIKSYGTWTVTATNGVDTVTQEVLIDCANEYSIEMDYKLWLYKDGYECTDLTGGWANSGYTYGGVANQAVTKYSDSMYATTHSGDSMTAGIVNPVDVTNYSTLFAEVMRTDSANLYQPWVGIASDKSLSDKLVTPYASEANVKETLSIDITSLTGNKYVAFIHSNGSQSGSGYVYKIWLE